ncbi:unnamed protein product [Staurois parvus]|uniref:Uncharacterized protein n=1 Tax=Staurois parvus TaxID=386267 RepID=A0ABN9C6N6_9NEOB|nr:unnamed protein product [Staurois parvus]
MHSPKKKKHQTEHEQSDSTRYVLPKDKRGALEEGEYQNGQD